MYEGKVSSNQCNDRWLQVGYDKKVGIRETVYNNDANDDNNSNPGDIKILKTPQVGLGEKRLPGPYVPARWSPFTLV